MRIVIEIAESDRSDVPTVPPTQEFYTPVAVPEAPPEEIRQVAEALGALSAGAAPAALRATHVPTDNLTRPSLPTDAARPVGTDAGAAPERLLQRSPGAP